MPPSRSVLVAVLVALLAGCAADPPAPPQPPPPFAGRPITLDSVLEGEVCRTLGCRWLETKQTLEGETEVLLARANDFELTAGLDRDDASALTRLSYHSPQ